jgi:hypothetical protein
VLFADLARQRRASVDWLWRGYLARGNVTVLTSQWKTGKTTLLAVLLSKLSNGGKLAGLEVQRARAAVATEETPQHWQIRGERIAIDAKTAFFCQPFSTKPSLAQWRGLVDRLVRSKRPS